MEDLAKSNYRSPTETSRSNNRLREGGMLELNKMTAILMSKMRTQEMRSYSVNLVGTEEGGEQNCNVDEGLAHEGPYQAKEA